MDMIQDIQETLNEILQIAADEDYSDISQYTNDIVEAGQLLGEQQQEIKDLKFQRDSFEKAAKEWMRQYQELKNKYEPEILVEQS